MWKYLIIVVAVISVLWILYTRVIKPYQTFSFYKNQFKDKNYKSFNFPFIPLAAPSIINGIRE
jgi:hypothetical protein